MTDNTCLNKNDQGQYTTKAGGHRWSQGQNLQSQNPLVAYSVYKLTRTEVLGLLTSKSFMTYESTLGIVDCQEITQKYPEFENYEIMI